MRECAVRTGYAETPDPCSRGLVVMASVRLIWLRKECTYVASHLPLRTFYLLWHFKHQSLSETLSESPPPTKLT